MYTLILFIQYGIYFWHELAYTLYYISQTQLSYMRYFRLLSFNFDLHYLSELYLGTYLLKSNMN